MTPRYLIGPMTAVAAQSQTIHATRPTHPGSSERSPVLVDDATYALIRFDCGAMGSIEADWAAAGRTMDLSWEITGTNGALAFTQEYMNELQFCPGAAGGRTTGFRRIEAGPAHAHYANFCPAPGHHLGFNDLKVIEVAELIHAIAGGENTGPDFAVPLSGHRCPDTRCGRNERPVFLLRRS